MPTEEDRPVVSFVQIPVPEKPKKILYIITKSNWGGAQRHVFDLASHLPKDEFDISVGLGGEGVLSEKLTAIGIKTIKIPGLQRNVNVIKDNFSFAYLYRIIKTENPDIVHLHSSKVGGIGALAARLCKVPKIIFTAHGFAFNEKRPAWQKLIIKFLSWLTIVLSTNCIMLSTKELNQVKRWPFIRKKLSIVRNGIVPPVFLERNDARALLAEKANTSVDFFADKKIVCSVAELTRNKGLANSIKAFSNLEGCAYFIIGGGEDAEKLKKEIASSGLTSKVYLLGFLENATSFLRGVDIFLLPSLKEGLPYSVIEAGFAGLPIIATDVGGMREIIDDMKSGILINAGLTKEIQNAVQYLLLNPDKQMSFGQTIKNSVSHEFSVEKMVGETTKIYLA